VVIAKLNVVCIPIHEAKTNPPLIVYRNRILALSISRKRMEPVTGRHSEVIEARSEINILELSSGSLCHVSWHAFPFARGVEFLSTPVCERLDHWPIVTRHVTRGNCPVVPHNAAHQRRADAANTEHIYLDRAESSVEKVDTRWLDAAALELHWGTVSESRV
jgi:hypothetical protein